MGGLLREAHDLVSNLGGSIPHSHVQDSFYSYEKYHDAYGGDPKTRKAHSDDLAYKYYNLVTSFYEYGWGESFHFAHRQHGESFRESMKRQEHYVALHLGLKPGMKVLDVGCGIGGPLREIATFSGASITGLNINDYQIKRGIELNKKLGLDTTCDYLKADFMDIPVDENTYDAIYTIEACCHAGDLVALYKELKRVLKPGQLLFGYDWCMTEAYDPNNTKHKSIKEGIELGSGIPDLRTTKEYLSALKEAGFKVLMEGDIAEKSPQPWYEPLDPNRFSISGFRTTALGRYLTRQLVRFLEFIGLAPKGSVKVSIFLEAAGDALVAAGKLKIFTPMYFFLIQKPTIE